MSHPAIERGRTAVVTGGASGIGLAAATRFAEAGMKVCLLDLPGDALEAAASDLAGIAPGGAADVFARPTDVARWEDVEAARDEVVGRFGHVALLMNNAGIEAGGTFASPLETWHLILDVNLWGAVHGTKAFLPAMTGHGRAAGQGRAGAIINTGSKQGITTPPGNTPYNISKAALKAMTEALAHDLRSRPDDRISAHLLIPGFVFTGLTRARGVTEKPAAAWTALRTVDFMLDALGRGDFYILCPDNDVDRATDAKRILWAAGDIVENRPALSRWDARYKEAFASYMKG